MKHLFLTALFVSCFAHAVVAQVGINTTNPDSTALLDIHFSGTSAVGVLFPDLDSGSRASKKSNVSDGMVVFDREAKLLYYYDGIIKQWIALNPIGIVHDDSKLRDIRPQNSRVNKLNMSLGLDTNQVAQAKLDVNGNVRVRGGMRVDGNDTIQQNLWVQEATLIQQTLTVNGNTTLQSPTTINSTLTVNNAVTVTGNISAKNDTIAAKTFVGYGTIPIGGIIMWSGITPPDGWELCDGTGGRPDLKGRFIVGYNSADTDYNSMGNTGGQRAVILTTSQIPNHSHDITVETYGDYDLSNGGAKRTAVSGLGGTSWQGGGTVRGNISTNPNIGGSSHENRPPYYVLAFIMRVK